MALRTKRWNEPVEAEDGHRLLVCRIRPRGVAKATEPWDAWWPELGPSRPLLDAFHGKTGPAIDFVGEYMPRYLEEMRGQAQTWRIRSLAQRVTDGETITLLCSSACVDPERCHRTVLKRLIDQVTQAR